MLLARAPRSTGSTRGPADTGSARRLRRVLVTAVTGALVATLGPGLASPAAAEGNRATPGNFTGYGFDQCVAPSQRAMDAWLRSSPFWAVGIYISGDSRACTSQPNLTPAWVSTQLRTGWRLLPITLGPQASCTTRERYQRQVRINPDSTRHYVRARRQGAAEASKTVARATELGISPGSTLWYDLEGDFDASRTDCRDSALSFLSAWTNRLHRLGYTSGFYSSAGTGIRMLDDARVHRPGVFAMPDQIWVARWSGVPGQINDRRTTYLRSSGWTPHARVHQYRGGHNETHGGVTINIDSNFLDVGRGSVARRSRPHCETVSIDFEDYPLQRFRSSGDLVRAAQCLLSEGGWYDGPLNGFLGRSTRRAVIAYRAADTAVADGARLDRRTWTALLARGRGNPLMKYGAASQQVRRLQRSLNAADAARLPVDGIFESTTTAAVRRYQADHGLPVTGVVTEELWRLLRAGVR